MSATRRRPHLSAWQLINMSVGFFGIQHGFEIQFARQSAIYEKLGARPDQLPLLWLAAPLTGLIIQPIIGYMSDKTWIAPLRMQRRPYFLAGAVLATVALCLMPSSSSLWMAAGLLWVLDASLNISMEPFRAFVADKQNSEQRPVGYAMQSLMIGLGTIAGNFIASVNWNEASPRIAALGRTPVELAFYACAAIFLVSILWTVLTTTEEPPEFVSSKSAAAAVQKPIGAVFGDWARETWQCYRDMPLVMKRLAFVQVFTWMGLFCMWMYYSVAVAHGVFGASDPKSDLYDRGILFAARTMVIKGFATPLFALCIPSIVRVLGRAYTHGLALVLCGVGLLAVPFIKAPALLYLSMVGAGIGWASIVSMPYVILVDHLPEARYGIFMGMFNMFIVIPEILVSLGLGGVLMSAFGNNHSFVVGFGGVLILLAAALTPSLQRFEPRQK
jgi:maltose/moltooligosaccharide transporter